MTIDLNEEQRAAVITDSDKVLVASACGTGKTRTIMARIEFLLSQGIDSKNIFAITFTNAAAQEMRSRLPKEAEGVFIGTIHSLANYILLMNGVSTSAQLENENFDWLFEQVHNRDLYIPEVEHLLVDEFQDICDNEYEFMIKDLKPKNFYFCGDSCQSIYSFKGSNYHHFMRLVRDPSVTVFNLTYNYRCGADIIDYADTILASVTDIYKVPNVCMTARRGYVEVNQFEIHKILQELEMGEEYRSWFILCRTNKEVDDMIKVLEKNDIPCDTFKKADLDLSQLQERMKENTVKVLTIHTSKGLENDNVMVIGAHRWNDEEKRISYVAATRARNSLFWFIPKKAAAPRKKKENLSYMEF